MILVTGSTGKVGSKLGAVLAARGVDFRMGARSPEKVGCGMAAVAFDFNDPETYGLALDGVDHLFLLPPFVPNQVELGAAVVEAAKQAGVEHVVKLSAFGCENEPGIQLGRWHRELEKVVEASGIGWTFLRPNNFMENLITFQGDAIRGKNSIFLPFGDGAVSNIAVQDIAEVAAAALLDPGHLGQSYTLTGPEALTVGQQAEALSGVLGRQIDYVDVPDEAVRESMAGAPDWMIDAMMELNAIDKAGYAAAVTDVVEKVLGRPATPFAHWVEEHAKAFAV